MQCCQFRYTCKRLQLRTPSPTVPPVSQAQQLNPAVPQSRFCIRSHLLGPSIRNMGTSNINVAGYVLLRSFLRRYGGEQERTIGFFNTVLCWNIWVRPSSECFGGTGGYLEPEGKRNGCCFLCRRCCRRTDFRSVIPLGKIKTFCLTDSRPDHWIRLARQSSLGVALD